MKHHNQILMLIKLDDGRSCPWLWQIFVIRMLTCDLFAVANLLASVRPLILFL